MGFKKWISSIVRNALSDIRKEENTTIPSNFSSNVSGLDDTYLFDFKNYGSAYSGGFSGTVNVAMANGLWATNDQTIDPISNDSLSSGQESTHKPKIRVTPKSVLHELETVATPFSLANLDDKIIVLKDKEKLITQAYAKREMGHLIQRIENRKKYAEHKEFFDRFQNTTDEKIDALLKNHDHLVQKTSDLFIPEFPDEAISVMKAYTEKTALICEKKPVFYVIAEADKFKEAFKKRDPILLVQSPFGFYWQILGAWDEEMLLLSEL